MNKVSKACVYLFSVASMLLLSACSEESAAPAVPMSMPPPAVSVAQVIEKEISEWDEFTGRLEAVKNVELRPRVSGYIESVEFTEGALVEKGQLLFKIDAQPFRSEVSRLEAELTSAQAQIDLAERDLGRASSLKQTNAISQELLDNRTTQLTKAGADADSVKAALRNAQLNLSYTNVSAPISGRVSKANITEGNYVAQGESILTTLVSTHKMYAYFDVNEHTYMQISMLSKSNGRAITDKPVLMNFAEGEPYDYRGKIDFVDNQIDTSSGTIRLRAVFENTDGLFTPGMFVRLKMQVSHAQTSILVNEIALGTDLNHKFVLVVGPDNKTEYRAVELGPRMGTLRVIASGLSKDDVIIVKGLQRTRPGAEVTPEMIEMVPKSVIERMDSLPSQG
ncbi:MAG: multidrug efflux system membrane fusion protein [Oleiphilaceae bacterium]|jgi:multidrug efflux system membrane fusion protein